MRGLTSIIEKFLQMVKMLKINVMVSLFRYQNKLLLLIYNFLYNQVTFFEDADEATFYNYELDLFH